MVVLLALVLAASVLPGALGATGTQGPAPTGNGPGQRSGPGSLSTPALGIQNVSETLSLQNGSVFNGVPETTTGAFPVGLAFDPVDDRILAADVGLNSAPAVSVVSGSTERLLATESYTNGTPSDIVVDPALSLAFVSDYVTNEIRVYNLSSFVPLATIPVGAEPNALTLDAPRQLLYVTFDLGTNVTILNATGLHFERNLSLPHPALGGAVDSRSNRLYFAEPGAGAVAILNGSSGALLGEAAAGTAPQLPAYDARTDEILVPDAGGTNLTVLNGSSGAPVGSFASGPGPARVAVEPGTGELFVADSRAPRVTVLDSTGALVENLTIGPVGVAPTCVVDDPVDGRLFVAAVDGTNLSVINVSTGRLAGAVSLGERPIGLTIDSGGSLAVVPNAGFPDALVVALPSLRIERSVSLPWIAVAGAPGPAGTALLAGTGTPTVESLNESSGALGPVVVLGGTPSAIAYDAPSGRVFVAFGSNDSLASFRLGAPAGVVWVTLAASAIALAVAPDGAEVYGTLGSGGEWVTMNGTTGDLTATVVVPGHPGLMAPVPARNALAWADGSNGSIATTSLSSGLTTWLATGVGFPTAMLGDPATGDLDIGLPAGGVEEVDWLNGSLLRAVHGSLGTNGLAADLADGWLLTSNLGAGTISVVPEPQLGPGSPTFSVDTLVSPSSCGPVQVWEGARAAFNASNGARWASPAGPIRLVATTCPGMIPFAWYATAGAVLNSTTGPDVSLNLSGPAQIGVAYERTPLLQLRIVLNPAICGPLTLGSASLRNGAALEVLYGSYVVTPPRCSGLVFVSMSGSPGIDPTPDGNGSWSIAVHQNGTLTLIWSAPSGTTLPSRLTPVEIVGLTGGGAAAAAAAIYFARRRRPEPPPGPPPGPVYPERTDPSTAGEPPKESSVTWD